jgi:srf22D
MDSTFWNLRHSETGRQLIMFPFLGGFGASYNRLISDLDGDWDVWTANPPGHGPSPVPPLTDLASLRTHYLDALRDILKPDAVFFGHSMGSVVAYHLLACMHRLPAFADRMPSDLVLSGSCAPHHLPVVGKADLADTDLVLHLASFGAIPDEVVKDKSLMDLFVPAFRADYKVLEEMITTPTENLPIRARLVFGGRDPQIPEDTPAAWQKYFASPVKTHVLEREEHMFVLHTTEALNQILNRL